MNPELWLLMAIIAVLILAVIASVVADWVSKDNDR